MKSYFAYSMLVLLGLSLVALFEVMVSSGCSAGAPDVKTYDLGKPPVLDTVFPVDNWSCSDGFSREAPKLTGPANFTNQTPQPFRGKAAGAKQIVVTGGPANTTANVGSSGTFCVDVSLTPDSTTTLYFQAVDGLGCFSAKTSHQVAHKSKTQADAGITTPVNLAYKKTIDGTSPDTGYLKSVNDGDSKTSATFTFWDWGNSCAHVRVDLGESYQINKFKLRWDPWADTKYATEYKVLLSTSASPAAPDCSGGGSWTMVLDKKGEDSTTKDLPISPREARWAALLMYENGAGGITDVYEDFMLAEFEIWGQTSGATKPPPPDKCP